MLPGGRRTSRARLLIAHQRLARTRGNTTIVSKQHQAQEPVAEPRPGVCSPFLLQLRFSARQDTVSCPHSSGLVSLSLPPRVLQLVGSAFRPALVTSACFGKQFCGRIRSGARDSLKFLRTDQVVSSHLCDFSSRIFESYHGSDI